MTAPSDPVDLAEVRALLAGATPGPWTRDWTDEIPLAHENVVHQMADVATCTGWGPANAAVSNGATYAEALAIAARYAKADADLIAAAPTLLAELADEVERLRGVVGRVREVLTEEHQPVQYGHDGITQACRRCSSWSWEGLDDETVPWPCPTVVALDPPAQADTEEGT